ncbi:hypothetical protein MRX96_024571, partial [Rhipicephalus microplus]
MVASVLPPPLKSGGLGDGFISMLRLASGVVPLGWSHWVFQVTSYACRHGRSGKVSSSKLDNVWSTISGINCKESHACVSDMVASVLPPPLKSGGLGDGFISTLRLASGVVALGWSHWVFQVTSYACRHGRSGKVSSSKLDNVWSTISGINCKESHACVSDMVASVLPPPLKSGGLGDGFISTLRLASGVVPLGWSHWVFQVTSYACRHGRSGKVSSSKLDNVWSTISGINC